MAKIIQQSIALLIVLLLVAIFAAVGIYMQKLEVEQTVEQVSSERDAANAEKSKVFKQYQDMTKQAEALRKDIETKNQEKATVEKRLEDVRKEVKLLGEDVLKAKREKEDIERRMREIADNRDELMQQVQQLKNRPAQEKIVEKIVYRDAPTEEKKAPSVFGDSSKENEDYWAGVVRAKTALEMELDQIKKDLVAAQIKVQDFQKVNSDLEIEIGRLKNEKEEIVRKIKYGEDLADNLSIELARARNDQRAVQANADRMSQENQALRSEIKSLTTTKVSLEKSISRLTEEKSNIQKKLVETESIIQGRIDEIWRMKKDVDNRLALPGAKTGSLEGVELPPIVVNANASNTASVQPPIVTGGQSSTANITGSVVSVNVDNNFVIINIGQKAGVKVGDQFKVYRGGSQIGLVQVIQVRQDISAADIKQKTAGFKPGDSVR